MNPARRSGPVLPPRLSRHAERGSSLFLLLILAVVMATVVGGIFSYISINAKAEKRSNARLESTYAAEYAFEQAYQQLVTLIGQNTVNLPTVTNTSAVTNLTTAPTAAFGTDQGYTWKAFLTVPVENGVPVGAHSNFNPAQGNYKFMTVVEFTRQLPQMVSPVHMQFQREWVYSITPLFQYAIFYNSDLELFPGATFNVSGRVHSNGRIYTGTTASITFNDYVTHVNGVSNTYSPNDPRSRPASLNAPTYGRAQPIITSRQNPPGQLGADTSDANYNNDGPHELIEVPNSWQSDANASDRMYNKAGLKVLVNTTSAAVTSDSGVPIPANSKVFVTADGTAIPASDPLASYLATLISTGTSSNSTYTLRDYREGATLTTTNVDVGALTTAQDAGGLPQTIPNATSWPNNNSVPSALKNQTIPVALRGKSLWNGVLYVADVTNAANHRTGVKIVNGGSLPRGANSGSPVEGLTIVSPNPAYVVGNYNTGGSPPSNSGTNLAADRNVNGYTVQPAAIVADAITVLSSNWSNTYDANTSLGSRQATNTTINTALISGVVASNGQAYSGGVENYIRLLEDWGSPGQGQPSRRLTYYGSMINVYQSQQATAAWQTTGNYYNAPARNWYFDTNFSDPNKLPPGTPMLRTLRRGQWAQIE